MSPVTNLLRNAAKIFSAYLIVQITVGLQLGIAIAWGFLAYGIPLPIIMGALLPVGVPLTVIQLPFAIRTLS